MASRVQYPRRAGDKYVFLVGDYNINLGNMEKNVGSRVIVTKTLLKDPECSVKEIPITRPFGNQSMWVGLIWIHPIQSSLNRFSGAGYIEDVPTWRNPKSHNVLYIPHYPVTAPTKISGSHNVTCTACVENSKFTTYEEDSISSLSAKHIRKQRKLEMAKKRDDRLKGLTPSERKNVLEEYRMAFKKAHDFSMETDGYALRYQAPESVCTMFMNACELALEKNDPYARLDCGRVVGDLDPWRKSQLKTYQAWDEWAQFVKNVRIE